MKVKSIKKIEYTDDVYNLRVKDNHNYFANNLLVSNCHLIVDSANTGKTKKGEKKSTGAIKEISMMCSNADFRWGLTGTLSDDKCDMWTLTGYIGKVLMETRSSEYIEKGILSKMKVVNLFAKYPANICQSVKGLVYQDEVDFVLDYPQRNKALDFILKCVKPEDNILLLVTKIDKQLKPLESYIKANYPNKKLYIIYGKTEGEEREFIRKTIETESGCILLASYGTLSTGVNIRKLHHVVFFSSYRSKIKVLQSIGRGLRTHAEKAMLIVWDVIDDLRRPNKKSKKNPPEMITNHLFKQWEDRNGYYQEQGFKTIDKTLQI